MTEIERAIESAETRKGMFENRLEHSTGNEQTKRKLVKQIEVQAVTLEALREKQQREYAGNVSKALFDQIKWERDMAMMTLEEHGIGFCRKAEPLTVEEIRAMNGEPIWVTCVSRSQKIGFEPLWMIVDAAEGEAVGNGEYLLFEDYDTVWLAYRTKPQSGEGG